MLIGIDASRANRDHKSGTEWYSYYLIRALAAIDRENQYILYTDKPLGAGLLDLTGGRGGLNPAPPGTADSNGQKIVSPHNNFRAKVLKWPFNFFWTQGRLSLEMMMQPPDVLFVPSHTLPLIHPAKSVVTIHDIGFERDKKLYLRSRLGPEDRKGRLILDWLVRFFTKGRYGANSIDYNIWSTIFALRRARRIITVSEFSKKEILEVYGVKSGIVASRLATKINVIHNGYNARIYRKINDQELVRRKLARYNIEPPYIFYVGRLERKKNTPNLVEAFALLVEKNKQLPHKLVLAGDASYGYDEVKYMVNQYGLDDRVVKTGWVEEDDLPFLYSGASLFVFPSFYEGFGIPLLQAMACEMPIAASTAASIPEVAGDAALLFDPEEPASIAAAMEKILSDGKLREQLIANGRRRVAEFSWEKSATETLKLLQSL